MSGVKYLLDTNFILGIEVNFRSIGNGEQRTLDGTPMRVQRGNAHGVAGLPWHHG